MLGLLFWVAVLVPLLRSAPQDNGPEDELAGLAPAVLIGKQFTLEGIDSSGVSEEAAVVFREGDLFDATRSAAKAAAADDGAGSYTYRRTGPYTGTLDASAPPGSGPSVLHRPPHLHFSHCGGLYRQLCRRVQAHRELPDGA